MGEEDRKKSKEKEFGPVFSRIYSFFSSRSGKSVKSFQLIVEDIASHNPKKVLDLGCGPGVLIEMLSSRLPDSRIFGADPSSSMVSIAGKRLSRMIAQQKVAIMQGDSQNIGFDEKFDLIVTTKSFHHWEDREASLGYLKTLLNENGSIIIYESLAKEDPGDNGKMHHSLSVPEAEKINVEGMNKTVSVKGDIISVKLSL